MVVGLIDAGVRRCEDSSVCEGCGFRCEQIGLYVVDELFKVGDSGNGARGSSAVAVLYFVL